MEPLGRIGRATIDVLGVLIDSDQPRWGLEIIKATGRPSGSVYPLLDRLEQAGWVTSQWDDDTDRRGPRRRMYRLTTDGAAEAREVLAKAATRKTTKHAAKPEKQQAWRPQVAR
jgi:PadR family transcriptional regulator, regulatory protein PadR